MKKCNRCGEAKPLTEYHKNCATRDGHLTICKCCVRARQKNYVSANKDAVAIRMKEYHAANRPKILLQQRAYRQKHKARLAEYRREKENGFPAALFLRVLEAQGHKCAICETDLRQVKPAMRHADHCHKSGNARGVLCVTCNTGLGKFKDDAGMLRRAIAYLEDPPADLAKLI